MSKQKPAEMPLPNQQPAAELAAPDVSGLELSARAEQLDDRELSLDEKEEALKKKDSALSELEVKLSEKAKELDERLAALEEKASIQLTAPPYRKASEQPARGRWPAEDEKKLEAFIAKNGDKDIPVFATSPGIYPNGVRRIPGRQNGKFSVDSSADISRRWMNLDL